MNLVEHYTSVSEWEREPNYKQFRYNDYLCVITRDSLGILHGYVALPNYDEYRDNYLLHGVSPHEGIAFANAAAGILPETGNYGEELYWIGFHCGGKDDLIPAFAKVRHKWKTYRNISFVENEIRKMVDQIIKNR